MNKNKVLSGRIAPCVRAVSLLKNLIEMVARATSAEMVLISCAGAESRNGFKPASMNQMNLLNLICREIGRGKILRQKNQPRLEERTLSAPNK
jgi:hypothetical protein